MIEEPARDQVDQESVRRELTRLRDALHASGAGAWSWDIVADVVWWSDGLTDLFGLSPEDRPADAATYLLRVHPDDREAVERSFQEAISNRTEHVVEHRVELPGGAIRWLASRGRVDLDDAGNPRGITGVVFDITPQRTAKAELDRLVANLAQERAWVTAVLDQLPNGVIVAEAPTGRTILNNRAAGDILGYEPIAAEQLEQYAEYTLLHPDGRRYEAADYPLVRAITAGETSQEDATSFVRGDGTQGTLSISAAPVRDADGQVIAGVVVYRDVSERTLNEERQAVLAAAGEALAVSLDYESTLQDLARLTVPAIADACVIDVLGPGGEIRAIATFAEPAILAVLAELRERFPATMSRPYGVARVLTTGRPTFLPDIRDERRVEMAVDPEHLRLLRALGSRSNITVPLVARGEILGALTLKRIRADRPRFGLADLAFAEDLGRRTALALDNSRLLRDAQSAVNLRDEFLSSASHDLKNPLTAIRGRVQLLTRRIAKDGSVAPDRMTHGLTEIETAAAKMQRMIDEMQDVSSLQIGRPLTLDQQPVDLVQLTRDMAAVAGEVSSRHRIILAPNDEAIIAAIDPGRIGRVLDNLIGNAIKYSPDGGDIFVTVARESGPGTSPGWVVIAVRDTGIGIPAKDLPCVFERYFRGSNAAWRADGSGIGLAGAHLIVTQHGGTIAVESEEGAGSTFTVRLPLR